MIKLQHFSEFTDMVQVAAYFQVVVIYIPADALDRIPVRHGDADLVTIVIPNYNGADCIAECLESIYAGTVVPGNVTVDVGDDIMWVDSLGVWQPKITDHLHHDETLVGTGSANDPLGVNPETIEDNILRMRYRGGGRLKFWRTNPLPTT